MLLGRDEVVRDICPAYQTDALVRKVKFEPFPKNPLIANFFRNIGYSEKLGSGARKIFKYGHFYSGVEPEFFEDDVFRIIQPLNENYSFDAEIAKKHEDAKTTPKNYPEKWAEISDLGTSSQKSSQKIIDLIASNPSVTTQELADSLGISRRSIAKAVAKLQKNGIIRRVGPDKGGYWQIVKNA